MSSSTAQQYIDLFGDDRQARLALLACSAALRLDDETAHAAIELVAQSNGSTGGLLRRVKNLGCVWREWDGSWYVAEDVRPHLLERLHEDVPEATLVGLRERLASSADARAKLLPPDGQVTSHDKLLSKFEAAYQRVLIPEKSDEGAAQLAELWQHSPPAEKRATEQSVDYLADEIDGRLGRLPDGVLFLRGMAARSRGDKKNQEKYFREVWQRGHHGYIYAVAAHLFALLIKHRDHKTAERALLDGIRWAVDDYARAMYHHSLGNLLSKDRNRWQEAEAAYARSIELAQDDDYSRAQRFHSLGNLLSKDRNRWQEAEKAYKQSLKLYTNPQHQKQVYHSLGNLLSKDRSRWQEAERAYGQSLELDKDDHSRAETLHSLGKLLFNIPGKREEADSALEESYKLRDKRADKAQSLATWAEALSKFSDPDSDRRAEDYALRGIALDPYNPRTCGILQHVLTLVYERREDYPKAIKACEAWRDANVERNDQQFVDEAQAKLDELNRKKRQQDEPRRKKEKKKWWDF